MALYKDIPHLLAPVINEPEKCISALKWAVAEMERRLRAFAAAGKRNIAEYNKLTGGESESVKPAVSEVGLPPIKEKWTIGELTLIYRETKSAKAMLRVWIDGSQIYGQNLLDKPIDLTGFIKYNGIIESESMGALTAKQKESIGSFEGITGTIELWYEIKTP